MPNAGGYLDQSPMFMEALQVFRGAESDYRNLKEQNAQLLKKLGA